MSYAAVAILFLIACVILGSRAQIAERAAVALALAMLMALGQLVLLLT